VQVATSNSLNPVPDTIKIDIESFEYHVLKGIELTETLAGTALCCSRKATPTTRPCHELLQNIGCRIHYLDREARYTSETPGANVGNRFVMPKSRLVQMVP